MPTSSKKLHVAFVWHMHQPLYKDRASGKYMMPWVRLHAQKDYVDMPAALARFPRLHQTFNLVPSLLEQLEDYAERGATDRALDLLVTPVDALTPADQEYLLERFFDVNRPHMLAPHARYAELAALRDAHGGMHLADVARRFSPADWADLTVWFHLAWFDPRWREEDAELAALVARGRGFTQADRELLSALCREYTRRVVPTYRELAERGQIELTTTPYYHPILPLLCDTESARLARPALPLPAQRFAHPEDARTQLERGLAAFERHFGWRPRGMWPSEQAVSPEAVALMAEAGVSWAISDENVLSASLGLSFQRDGRGLPAEAAALYQPYRVDTPAGPVAMVFRDIVLSDMIGFEYGKQPAEVAAKDLHDRLTRLRAVLPDGQPHLVTIALDGENCWEHYEQDGGPFLEAFYRLADADAGLALVSVGEYLDAHPPTRQLERLHAGSWIGADYTTWIGEPTKNRAWELLLRARSDIEAEAARHAGTPSWDAAWEELLVAEGSDWFWWFGEGHDSGQDELFDYQFRLHLQGAYAALGMTPPDALFQPLSSPSALPPAMPHRAVSPQLDGRLSDAEWEGAGCFDPTQGQGAMHRAAKVIAKVRYGYDHERFYMGIAFAEHYRPDEGDEIVWLACYPGVTRHNAPVPFGTGEAEGETKGYAFAHALHVRLGETPSATLREAGEHGVWRDEAAVSDLVIDTALELALPFHVLEAHAGLELQFVVAAVRGGELVEIWPAETPFLFSVPSVEVLA